MRFSGVFDICDRKVFQLEMRFLQYRDYHTPPSAGIDQRVAELPKLVLETAPESCRGWGISERATAEFFL